MKLKELRIKAGKNQSDMARLLNISQTVYSSYETGKNEPNIETLSKLADYFHTTVDSLLGHEVPYLFDKSTLTKGQKAVFDLLPEMSDNVCEKAEAYISGLIAGEKDKYANVQKWTS